MRGPPSAPTRREEVLAGYRAFCRGRWAEGKLSPCEDPALKSQARRLLRLLPAPARPRVDVAGIAESSLAAEGERPAGRLFRMLGRAFGFLELLCLNLSLSPWRKEIRSLKTFTGSFVYCIQSVLPEGVVKRLLEEIGYVPTTSTEFSLVKKLNEEEAEQAAFELFLARIECEDLLEMAEDVRGSDLVDILQKRGQKHGCPEGNLAGKHQPSQRKGCQREKNETEIEGFLDPQSGYWTRNKLVVDGSERPDLRSEFVLGCPAEPQTVTSEPTPEQNTSERNHEEAFSASGIKSSDSEDFYSDIVIGQKPLQFTDLPPKASDDAAQAAGFVGTRLLSPDASGPQALAILSDGTLGSSRSYDDCRTQQSCRAMVESKICRAVNCLSIHGPDSTDQPKELKGNSILHSSKLTTYDFSSEKEVHDLFSSKPNMQMCKGKLMCPVEETVQQEQTNRTSKRDHQQSDRSKMKVVATGGDKQGFLDLYSATALSCNIPGCECPTVGSNYNRVLEAIPSLCGTRGYSRHVGGQPSSCCTAAPEASYHGVIPADALCQPEGCSLHARSAGYDTCVAPVNEFNPESYVVVNKND
ncbi:uncharacterized protein LOC110090661 [Pogona vitticeps]